ncbi:MAG: hypothetical protein CVV44_17395 [Spirochaetae bacterium HGW-Spirochaetae-1]|jgi:hypothetical protein|nr:MAG: hypothetical protein CVV44_17395 [Spirochaetae bacterium HGW-Spirochaetae-1]
MEPGIVATVHLRKGIITKSEHDFFITHYTIGFHVYFKPVKGDNNEILFRAAEYIAAGFFHNRQIVKIDNARNFKKALPSRNILSIH